MSPPLSLNLEVSALLTANAPVAIGVSGGKDSCAVAFAVTEHLDGIGHVGPRILVHSDLGRVEWKESGPVCHRLAERLGLELLVVCRRAGGMMERWLGRWENNVARYAAMECVKLILPWSTPSMRFCTAELKRDVICSALVRRFPGQTILSACGIRRQESPARAKAEIAREQIKLTNRRWQTRGLDWNPILDWTLDDVLVSLAGKDFPLHEAYTKYGSSRVSCAFCILASKADLRAASSSDDNVGIYREMVDLELQSTFSFQDAAWLADVAPDLLTTQQRDRLPFARERAALRVAAESMIPSHLLYTSGWPTCIPTEAEAQLLCHVRRQVAEAVGLKIQCRDPNALINRYEELMAAKRRRECAA